ncbi:hypothetical protein [Saccharicrinis aurantiacus]|uniref:hypothetical protein n=1 Tax=Saccharicrinis aurantiacus TaxID=1849719 RepID=UPI0024929BB7|nr:hypothetical protein [Saccharicrinis aurantiacus]
MIPDIELSAKLAHEVLQVGNKLKTAIDQASDARNNLSGIAQDNANSADFMQKNSTELNLLALNLNELVKNFKF